MSRTPTTDALEDLTSAPGDAVVTLYCVNGLSGGNTDWLGRVLPEFTAQTGIAVRYLEDHSRDVVDLLEKERANPRADVLITLPPFIQMAKRDGLLEPYRPAAAAHLADADQDSDNFHYVLMKNYPTMICNTSQLKDQPASYADLLQPRFHKKIQYSKPGWSGAGTSLLLQVHHAFGGMKAGLEYLAQLQDNCLAPAAHTQGLAERINSGDLFVANGDLQTNLPQLADHPDMKIIFPAGPDGQRAVFEFPYCVALVNGAPNCANAKALINHLLSKSAQSVLSAAGYGLPGRQDIRLDDDNFRHITQLTEGVEIWTPNWSVIADTLDDDVAHYEKMILK